MSSFDMPGEAWAKVETLCEDLVKREAIAVDELTQKQLASALRQAIACGDFLRLVQVDNRAQALIYIPFAREQQLEARVRELESILAQFRFEVSRLRARKVAEPWDTLEYFLADRKV